MYFHAHFKPRHTQTHTQAHTKVQAAGEFALDWPACGSGTNAAVSESSGWDFKKMCPWEGYKDFLFVFCYPFIGDQSDFHILSFYADTTFLNIL